MIKKNPKLDQTINNLDNLIFNKIIIKIIKTNKYQVWQKNGVRKTREDNFNCKFTNRCHN